MAIQRIRSGVAGLDELNCGGFPEGFTILLSGSPGTCKSTFGMQFLCEGARNGEAGIYATLDEPKNVLCMCSKELGIDPTQFEKSGKITMLECMEIGNELYLEETAKMKKSVEDLMKLKILLGKNPEYGRELESRMEDMSRKIEALRVGLDGLSAPLYQQKRQQAFFDKIQKAVVLNDAKRIVIDSLSAYMIHDESRSSLHWLLQKLKTLGATTLLISEIAEKDESVENIAEYLVDGVVSLYFDPTMDLRKLSIRKMRGTNHTLKPQTFILDKGGIRLKKAGL